MPKWLKLIVGLLLLPVCAGAAGALWSVLRASGGADAVWIAILSGAACWVVITPPDLWFLAGAVVGISLAASLLGIWKALRISPNTVLS